MRVRDFATAKHRKGVGAFHLTCAWLLVDAPTIAPIPAA
jgi:hypothetical protein